MLMNETVFFLHALIVVGFLILATRLGKMALYCFVAIQGILANLFVLKQMKLFGLVVTCADVYTISCIFGINIICEFFGKKEANKAILLSLFLVIFYLIMTKFHLFYIPISNEKFSVSYETILSTAPRIVISSILVFYVVQRIDVLFFSFLKRKVFKNSFLLRLTCSVLLTQFLDTFLFSFLGLYGTVQKIFQVITMSYLMKVVIIAFNSSFCSFLKRFIKQVEVK